MWATILGLLNGIFKAIPQILDFLNAKKVIDKKVEDKEERAKDIEETEKSDEEIENIVKDGDIDAINDKLDWNE